MTYSKSNLSFKKSNVSFFEATYNINKIFHLNFEKIRQSQIKAKSRIAAEPTKF